MADISKITMPSGTTYDIKDATARELIEELAGYSSFLGVTTTALSDGATTNPITVNEQSVTAKSGDIAAYGPKEFIFNGSAWQEFGDLSGLGSLAFKNSATGSFTPNGNVNVTVTDNAQGDLSFIESVGLKIGGASTGNYTPGGTISTPTITVTPSTTTVNSITNVGTLPSFTATVENEVLSFGWSAGTLPTKGSNTTVATGIQSATSTQPSFTGTQTTFALDTDSRAVKINGSFSGTAGNVTVS